MEVRVLGGCNVVRRQSRIILCVLTFLASSPALAEDLHPPIWRGQPGSAWVVYEFNKPLEYSGNPPYYPTPDGGYLPFGQPVLTYVPGPGAGWHPKQPTWAIGGGALYDPPGVPGDGWLNLSGEITLWMPNSQVPNPRKDVWIQFVWEPQAPGNVPTLQFLDPLRPPTTIPLVRTVLWQAPPTDPNPWRVVYHDVWHINLYPNPPSETFQIRGGVNLDELVVDTWCVPEPAILLPACIGALALLRRRSAAAR